MLLLQVQARCYQLLLSVFQHCTRALSTPYIHALAPLMVEKLKAVERSPPGTPAELQAVQEGIRVLETLVAMGEEQNRKCDWGTIESGRKRWSRRCWCGCASPLEDDGRCLCARPVSQGCSCWLCLYQLSSPTFWTKTPSPLHPKSPEACTTLPYRT